MRRFVLIIWCLLTECAYAQSVNYSLNGVSGNTMVNTTMVGYACANIQGTNVIFIAEMLVGSLEVKFYVAKNTISCTSGGNSNFSGGTWTLFENGVGIYTSPNFSGAFTSPAFIRTMNHTVGLKTYTASFSSTVSGQTWNMGAITVSAIPINSNPKVIGYLPAYQWGANFHSAYLERFTHLNLSFIAPTMINGAFITDSQGDYIWEMSNNRSIAYTKTRMQTWISNGFKGDYFFSIGGAEATNTMLPALRNALNSPPNRTKMINGLAKYLSNFDVTYKVKGIDLDLEYSAMNIDGYNAYLQLLADYLHTNNMLLSVATEYKYPSGVYVPNDAGTSTLKVLGSMIDDLSLSKVDWVNMMSYDYAQANDLSITKLGLNHSPYSLAERDFTYWNTSRGVPNNKIVLGLPIYGREAGGTAGEIAYRDIKCKEVPAWYNTDLNLRDNDIVSTNYCYYGSSYSRKPSPVTVYQNSKATLLQKMNYSTTNQLGGVMFWAIGNDIWEDENQSLLTFLVKKCPQSKVLNLSSASGFNLIEKGQTITSTGLINSGANVSLNAEKSIILNQNFEIKSGGTFKAEIKSCNN